MNSRGYFRSSKCGLGLIFNDETPRVFNPNVIESSSLVLANDIKPVLTPTSPPPLPKTKDPGGRIGFMPCTESLGFERIEERRVNDISEHHHRMAEFCEKERGRWRLNKSKKKKKFPPPLSSLNENGRPCFYLKPVRKNGGLELIKVKIQRSEILRAIRENGRLRLYLLRSHQDDVVPSKINEEKGEEKVEESWKYRVTEEGLRRCQDVAMNHHQDHHHHHHHQGWRQPCVTTR
ncbi:hypothetical protein V6N13_082628 [Hibiscus sabdariffa]|uniref:FAF domain-containing protein n=1 Tax=Hibiscus sabdariffa TaxID=183260 RepID=A0ABR2Q3Y0_9ROSI